MRANRIGASALSIFLLVLLGWMVATGAGDLHTKIILGAGAALGILYAILGRLPGWIVGRSGGFITTDNDPSNISPRVYLPILVVVISVAVIALAVVLVAM